MINVTSCPSYPTETALVSIMDEAGWTPETVCKGMEKTSCSSWRLNPIRPGCSKWNTDTRGPKGNILQLMLSCKVCMKDSSCSAYREIWIYDLLGFYATQNDNFLPTFRGNLTALPSRVKKSSSLGLLDP
jgi:hypothetical protein